jgi:hypothetical protein
MRASGSAAAHTVGSSALCSTSWPAPTTPWAQHPIRLLGSRAARRQSRQVPRRCVPQVRMAREHDSEIHVAASELIAAPRRRQWQARPPCSVPSRARAYPRAAIHTGYRLTQGAVSLSPR